MNNNELWKKFLDNIKEVVSKTSFDIWFNEEDTKKTASLIIEILSDPKNEKVIEHVKDEVHALTQKHPIE